MTTEPQDAHDEPSLRRVIGVQGVAFTSFNGIVGAGIFGLPALVAGVLGPAAILAYLVCGALIALVGLCFAEAGSRVSKSGGLYAYADASFGPVAAGVVGALMVFANSAASDAALLRFLTDTLATVWAPAGEPLVRTLLLAGLYLAAVVINIRGARQAARATSVMGYVKLAPLVLLILVGLFAIHPANLRWPGLPTAAAVGQGSMLLFFAFIGVENGLGASGEVINPARTIPRAILLALSMVGVLYIGLQVVSQGVLGPALPAAKAPLAATATAVFGPWGSSLIVAAVIVCILGFLVADVLSSPRGVFAMAERGQLPAVLARISPRHGTPAIAIGVYALACFGLAVSGTFRQLIVFATAGTMIMYLICCLGVLRLRAKGVAMSGPPFRAPGGPVTPILAAGLIVWLLSTLSRQELLSTGAFVLAAAVVYGAIAWRRSRMAPAGTPAEAEA